MKNETNSQHQAFYTYRHQINVELVEFLTADHHWTADFTNAVYQPDYEKTLHQAKLIGGYLKGYNICIGKVAVIIDPYFPLEVIVHERSNP